MCLIEFLFGVYCAFWYEILRNKEQWAKTVSTNGNHWIWMNGNLRFVPPLKPVFRNCSWNLCIKCNWQLKAPKCSCCSFFFNSHYSYKAYAQNFPTKNNRKWNNWMKKKNNIITTHITMVTFISQQFTYACTL